MFLMRIAPCVKSKGSCTCRRKGSSRDSNTVTIRASDRLVELSDVWDDVASYLVMIWRLMWEIVISKALVSVSLMYTERPAQSKSLLRISSFISTYKLP